MHFSTALAAAAAAIVPLVNAHEGAPIPRIAGLNIKDLKARDIFTNFKVRQAADVDHHDAPKKRSNLEARQNTDGQCGAGFGSCAAGYCCSEGGWCGKTADYCYSPGCNYKYGPGCPENVTPAGTNTSTVARTKVGSVAYGGAGIYNCVTPGTVAITYDDGPLQNYTSHILDIFKSYNARATFFITGNNINKGEIDLASTGFPAVIQRMHTDGHQIASHTWTHLDLSAITAVDRKNQMYKNEMALRNILGFFPTYMRPPYSSCTSASGCESDLANLGYHVIYFDVDTDDYNQDSPNLIQNAKNYFKGNITAGGATASNSDWLSISHDIHEQTAYNLTDFMLSTLTGLGYKAVTVGECLGDPSANWYRNSAGSTGSVSTSTPVQTSTQVSSTSSAPSATGTKKVSTDATCGGTNGFTCQGSTFGNCCSSAGWCGQTTAYCGTGCQPSFGTCSSSSSISSVKPSTSSKPVSSIRPSSTSTKPSASATPSGKTVSTDATCGGTKGFTCQGSTFGNCCSVNGWCGSTSAYCSTGCQSAFGTCGTSGTTSSPAPTSTGKAISTDGTCAGTTGFTCQGSTFGNCCSQYGWCGSTTGHCGTGCQTAFGTCT
ncbi:glycoside hydrolase/deacetylase [Lindgomyces ingoldianus]|uniref:Glycoside hydrolase/deacetylase n=1 Tax=Lindgomyces ingoldianus TaxID=673940 RepID=A0ACB6R1V9_9PLEO|nr:glycoside hydrolase/deacetylase [Lindgomyces ingoldianus]KAF2473248.1 glycoside hydrolase/deacetylase [Lindgomyces ingoldianus]